MKIISTMLLGAVAKNGLRGSSTGNETAKTSNEPARQLTTSRNTLRNAVYNSETLKDAAIEFRSKQPYGECNTRMTECIKAVGQCESIGKSLETAFEQKNCKKATKFIDTYTRKKQKKCFTDSCQEALSSCEGPFSSDTYYYDAYDAKLYLETARPLEKAVDEALVYPQDFCPETSSAASSYRPTQTTEAVTAAATIISLMLMNTYNS